MCIVAALEEREGGRAYEDRKLLPLRLPFSRRQTTRKPDTESRFFAPVMLT